jgi:hypothetical protein
VSALDKATLSSRTTATITAAARTIYPYDALLEDAVTVFARGQRRGLR